MSDNMIKFPNMKGKAVLTEEQRKAFDTIFPMSMAMAAAGTNLGMTVTDLIGFYLSQAFTIAQSVGISEKQVADLAQKVAAACDLPEGTTLN